jgi:hypothetical protein
VKSRGENVKIDLKIVKENKDGSANASVDFDKEGLEFLVQEGILSILTQYIKQNENAQKGIALRKRTEKSKARASAKTARKPANNKRSGKVSTRS